MLWAAIALTSHYFITHKNYINLISPTEKASEKTNISTPTILEIKNGSEIEFQFTNGIQITKNKEQVSSIKNIPYLIDSLSNFLKNNYNKQLELIGKYNNLENNSNLGVLRANALKNEFINNGFKPTKIATTGINNSFSFNKKDVFNNGVDIHIIPLNKITLDSLENELTNKTLYLKYTDNKILINSELNNYISLLKQYLKNNSTKTVEITGHTDNKGYYENNLIIGQNKANALKEYFTKNGISKNKINTFSKGESEPIANKYTEEGKALNNRIEIKIK